MTLTLVVGATCGLIARFSVPVVNNHGSSCVGSCLPTASSGFNPSGCWGGAPSHAATSRMKFPWVSSNPLALWDTNAGHQFGPLEGAAGPLG
ncbi:hypothetical protein GOBAR_AA24123 [Gossypium barbadense]|uniref:Secreted protein n=1 Tax=Gossypium barbadense TaxID=3634 RepID=A0A2P5WZN3_GOSBA|nr:hypothetical protein GOBAR_AA24123 [Gossypium barbadense]